MRGSKPETSSGPWQALLERSTPAKFGNGKRTLLDPAVRAGRRVKATSGIAVSGLDPDKDGILRSVQASLGTADDEDRDMEAFEEDVGWVTSEVIEDALGVVEPRVPRCSGGPTCGEHDTSVECRGGPPNPHQ
jgi:hypothetical protein